ncbi:hypothetical protein [Aeromicrobium sp. UC242_57]|uniref:hypothetical protein n=1 Tax=Aeromicrobium sp. UC242_57 TaxID=3374624 RepID=UPI0037968910
MTGPGRSPPRSKKESSDASDDTTPPVEDEPIGSVDETEPPARPRPTPAETKAAARAEARAAARRRRQEVKDAARRAKADDRIVEAPREPKVGLLQRRRRARRESQVAAGERTAPTASTASTRSSSTSSRRLGLLVAGLIGAAGLLCSVVLALGALLVALGVGDDNSAFAQISSICDVLVGPLRDVFSFTGANADLKESLVAWGTGSIGYLVVGMFVQSFLRARFDD